MACKNVSEALNLQGRFSRTSFDHVVSQDANLTL
jgi:hypothetical protein